MQRESAVEREAVEGATFCSSFAPQPVPPNGSHADRERSRFLPRARRDHKPQSVLQNLKLFRNVSINRCRDQRQTFEFTHARVVAFDQRTRLKFLDQYFNERRFE